MTRWHRLVSLLLFGLAVAIVYVQLDNVTDRVTRAEQAAVANAAAAAALAAQVEDLGGRPIIDPESLPETGPQGEPGEPGPTGPAGPGPTASQVALAVSTYCAGGRCDGEDGRGVTTAQVAAAVAAYCNARGECEGPEGDTGAAGADGGPGPQGERGPEGPQGADPTPAQIIDAVNTYCSSGGRCQGPAGPAGESPFPFTWTFTVQHNPVQSTTYTITCTRDGCTTATS